MDLSEENNKVIAKHFSGATATNELNSYVQPTFSNNPEKIVLHCKWRQDISAVKIGKKILEIAASCKSDSNYILLSGIVPSRDKLSAKAAEETNYLKNECS